MQIWNKIKRFLKLLNTPVQPLDPRVRVRASPALALAITVGGLLLELWYFYELPYASIPTKPVFWAALVGWGIPPVVLQWKWQNLPSKRALSLQANFFVAFGIALVILTIAVRKVEGLLPVVEAVIPGAIGGGILAAIGSLVWQGPDTYDGAAHVT